MTTTRGIEYSIPQSIKGLTMTKEPRHCCAHRGCTEWATHGSYCQKHYEQFLERQKEKKKKKFQTWQEYKKQTGYERPPEQKLYNCKRWRKTSQLYLIQHPVCEICGRPATDVDHIVPHKGDERLFWLVTNFQALCRDCHNKKTYEENVAALKQRHKDYLERKFKEKFAGMNVIIIK